MKTTPSYNLNVVIRETGIKPDTLRAWERRYKLPQPSRTEGGHRLYSERDIAIIKWLIERQKEGVRIKQAVDLWKQLEESGRDPFVDSFPDTPITQFEAVTYETSQTVEGIRSRWIKACLNFDEATADQLTNLAFALHPVETVCFDLLLAGLSEIGDAWYTGEASVQQEHFASALVIRRIDALIAATPTPTRQGVILIGCPPGEDHTIAPLFLTFLLRQRGWRVVYLGANVPQIRLEETFEAINPNLVILTAQHIAPAASILEIAEQLHQKGVRIAFGGMIFNRNPGLSHNIAGYFLGGKITNAVTIIEDILTKEPPIPLPAPVDQQYQVALNYYRQMLGKIEAAVHTQLSKPDFPLELLTVINQHLSKNIESALRLGSLDYLDPELTWINDLIANNQIKSGILNTYLLAYYQAALKVMDERGQLIIDWLSRNYPNSN